MNWKDSRQKSDVKSLFTLVNKFDSMGEGGLWSGRPRTFCLDNRTVEQIIPKNSLTLFLIKSERPAMKLMGSILLQIKKKLESSHIAEG